ncbi:cation-transporting P-type ATPase [Clostridium botulinum]|uniref:P-type ATPase n=1 Tax=Clostridium botulinum TaxID=1491 RepID=UPI00064C7943|nr:cation-transporting P-type ATPase [Clostridium botulinum]KLU76100.1 cation transporter [Clostridium botulinum V891]KOA75411.1 cation transporter [Clostridium botulinum]KOA92500.1 cation transporter [Clostridium botulinum]MCD3201957.1 cation-transporting P-type ATPase [Clostridium botulinum C/D]MCD3222872.1 cation-transporting P-type ATPase [Clostridium botulinum C/D]
MKDWYNYSWNEVVKELNSSTTYGLSMENVNENREEFGDNKTLNLNSKSFIILFLRQLIKLYSISGIITSVLLFMALKIGMALFMVIITLFCVTIYSLRNYKNENRLNYLRKITPDKALVIREGSSISINADELVVGDIVYLEEGDIVPADVRLIECNNLRIKESAITGDNSIVEKYETKIEDNEISPSEMRNMAFRSSFVIEGTAKAIVVEVGENTQIGDITKELIKDKSEKNFLEDKIVKLINSFSIIFIISFIGILIYSFLEKVNILVNAKIIALGYLIMVPIQVIIIIMLISFIIYEKTKRKGINLGGLSSMETLSSTDVLIANKIGSITEERAFVKKIYTNGNILEARMEENEEDKHNIDRIISIGVLCNDSRLDVEGKIKKGDFIDRALVLYGKENSINKNILEQEQERILQLPFDYERKIKTTLNKVEDKYRANSIGGVDKLIKRCTHIMKNGIEVEITPKDIIDIKKTDLSLAKESLYVVGFAYRNFNYEPSVNENIESNLVFVGLMGFENPCKENVINYMEYCRSLAIKPIIITDDNKITAQSIGESLKILNKNDMVLSGVEIDNMDDDELEKFVEKVGIYSKISSKIKSRICYQFKKLGYKLAVTGSRFTDLPSFKVSNVGIATGFNCTNIAKKLGDIYVEDNDFKGILNLIKGSRQLLKGIKNIILFNLIITVIEFLSVVSSSVLNNGITIGFTEIVLTNFVTVIVTSLMIYSETKNIEGKNYEKVNIDKTIFDRFSSGIMFYIIFEVIACIGMYNFNKDINITLANISIFTVLNLSSILFGFYFIKYKNVFKNRVASMLLVLNIIFYILFVQIFTGNCIEILKEMFVNSKIMIGIMLVQIPLINFIKELDDNSK